MFMIFLVIQYSYRITALVTYQTYQTYQTEQFSNSRITENVEPQVVKQLEQYSCLLLN